MRQSPEELAQIKAETDTAIERGFDYAHTKWREKALECVLQVATEKEMLTMNDVRLLTDALEEQTHDKRAMAGVMLTAKRLGWITHSGNQIVSRVGHKSPLQIWKSLVYKNHD